MDTSVLVAAVPSPSGAASLLVNAVVAGDWKPLVSVPLVLEYEAVLTRPEHLAVSGFTREEAVGLVKAFCRMGEPIHIPHLLRPRLRDPDDEFVLETAFHGKADLIVTFNIRDFRLSAESLGIEAITPREAVERMGRR